MVDTTKYFPLKRAQEPLLWSSFADRSKDLQEKAPRYKPIPVSLDVTKQSMKELLQFYHLTDSAEAARKASIDDRKLNTDSDMSRPPLPLSCLFDLAIITMLHLVRLLGCKAATHVTLVGKSGSGRKSMLKMAAYLVNLDVRSLTGDRFSEVLKQTLERLALTRDPLDEVDGETEVTAQPEEGAQVQAAAVEEKDPNDNDQDDDQEEEEEEVTGSIPVPVCPLAKSVMLMVVDEPDAKLNNQHFDMICSLLKV
jgi:hypothetical protein